MLGPPLTALRVRSISASWYRYSTRSSAPGRRASGGCTRSPTSMRRSRPVPVGRSSSVSLQLTSGPWERRLGHGILLELLAYYAVSFREEREVTTQFLRKYRRRYVILR